MTFVPIARSLKTQKVPAESVLPTVLYVEDEDLNWEVTESSVRDRYQLTRARNADEAVRVLNKRTFDLILMDIQLAGSELDGLELTMALRGRDGARRSVGGMPIPKLNTPIVFVTAYSARYAREDLLSSGGSDLVTKPISVTGLLLVMGRLSMRALRDSLQNTP